MKKILFLILAVIYAPLYAFLHFTQGRFEGLWNSEHFVNKILFLILAVIYFPLIYFLRFTSDYWEKLAED